MEPIRIGIVGTGRIVPAHLRGYALLRQSGYDNFRVTGLMSRRRADAETFRKRGEGPEPRPSVSKNPGDPLSAPHMYVSDFQADVEARVFNSLDEMLASGSVDALDIPASVFVHHEYALKAIEAGKHVLLQKPFSVSVAAGRKIVDAARAHGVTLGVTENVRYAPTARAARWAIERGDLGTPQMVASIALGTAEWSPDRVVADTPWRHVRVLAGGGATLDIGVHLFHRIRYLCGDVATVGALARTFEPIRYRRDENGNVLETIRADADDAFMATFELANGAIGEMSFTWAGHGPATSLPDGMVIYGTKGCLKGSTLYRDGQPPVEVLDLFEAETTPAERERWIPRGLTDSFAAGFYDFLTAIERGGQPGASGEEGLRDVATAFAILESSHAGHPVAVDDVLSGKVRAAQREIDEHYGLT
jgi:predicted dehydrogenase